MTLSNKLQQKKSHGIQKPESRSTGFGVRRRDPRQPVVTVVGQQTIDVGDVTHDLVVIGTPSESHQRTRDDVDEPPAGTPAVDPVAGQDS